MADLTIKAGDDLIVDITVDDGSSPLDLSTCTNIRFFIKKNSDPTQNPDISKELGDGITIIGDPSDGVFEVLVTGAETLTLNPLLDYNYVAYVLLDDGTTATVETGVLAVTPSLLKTT
ncbi:MAG TPA: hypothetical protein VGP72_32100 [Planctomycetota bacterium]|jgi:hypothetical protein